MTLGKAHMNLSRQSGLNYVNKRLLSGRSGLVEAGFYNFGFYNLGG
jgi:hypothetical protein